ncbi:MAG: hypothetical protein D6739_02575 [Nitrospirae bacterium]|nr:MAG: hypothetical protein D6739_02575 [Nitrospirota bacterium]
MEIDRRHPLYRDFVVGRARLLRDRVQRLLRGAMGARLAGSPADLVAPVTFVDTYAWLRREVPEGARRDVLSVSRNPAFERLVELLATAPDAAAFARGLVAAGYARATVARHGGDAAAAAREILETWERRVGEPEPRPLALRRVAAEERAMYERLLGPEDRERLALVDRLPDPGGASRLAKAGVIPVMRCPAGCRHCLFLYRPRVERRIAPEALLATLGGLTESLLYTGGDLTPNLPDFVEAVATAPGIRTFAILLNGTFGATAEAAEGWMARLDEALQRRRATGLGRAEVVVQVSFDELHQEILVRPDGSLRERIPVAAIANVVEAAVRHPRVGLALLHKQNRLSFGRDLFEQGAFARLARELSRRGHGIEILEARPGPRPRRDPCDPSRVAPVVIQAHFALTGHPEAPIGFSSTLVDGYGQAQLLEESERLDDRLSVERYLAGEGPAEGFDPDLMFWYDGRVTSFSAVHLALGDLTQEGVERIVARRRRDPLLAALVRADRRLLDLYAEVRDDLEAVTAGATSVPHLLHSLTREAEVRLHMTRRLAGQDG